MFARIHITGAPGSGTSTFGRALAQGIKARFFESDEFLWENTDPPFQVRRSPSARLGALETAIGWASRWVLSGSIGDWGDPIILQLDLVIFLSAPTDIRIKRIKDRDTERFGAVALAPGGALYKSHAELLRSASAYDHAAPSDRRSRKKHELWLKKVSCPILRLDGTLPLGLLLQDVSSHQEAASRRDSQYARTHILTRAPPHRKSTE